MKYFEEPKVEIVQFDAMDVITTSPGGSSCEDWGSGDQCMFD